MSSGERVVQTPDSPDHAARVKPEPSPDLWQKMMREQLAKPTGRVRKPKPTCRKSDAEDGRCCYLNTRNYRCRMLRFGPSPSRLCPSHAKKYV